MVHKGVNFEAPKCSKTNLRAPLISKKNFRGLYPRTPVKRGRGGETGRGGEGGAREGRPPIHIPGYATDCDMLLHELEPANYSQTTYVIQRQFSSNFSGGLTAVSPAFYNYIFLRHFLTQLDMS